jgi:hypothetical protein
MGLFKGAATIGGGLSALWLAVYALAPGETMYVTRAIADKTLPDLSSDTSVPDMGTSSKHRRVFDLVKGDLSQLPPDRVSEAEIAIVNECRRKVTEATPIEMYTDTYAHHAAILNQTQSCLMGSL